MLNTSRWFLAFFAISFSAFPAITSREIPRVKAKQYREAFGRFLRGG